MYRPIINEVKFAKILARRKMTLTDLAEKTGISRATLSKGLHHRRVNRITTLGKIAETLDVELEDFVDFQKES